jgi:hypothetical protein
MSVQITSIKFNFHGSVHHINIPLHVIPTRYTIHSQSLFLYDTAVHVSGVVTTHPQEHKATASTESGKY